MKLKLIMGLFVFSILITGCSKVEYFETSIDSINQGTLIVNCSNEVNRNKRGPINSIGYLCNIEVSEKTTLLNTVEDNITLEDFKIGDRIKITLVKPIDINEKNRSFEAKEIILID